MACVAIAVTRGAGCGDGQFDCLHGAVRRAPRCGRHGEPERAIGRKGGGDGEFRWPLGAAALFGGRLAVADTQNHEWCWSKINV